MKNLIAISLLLLLPVVSCKKDKKTTSPAQSSNTYLILGMDGTLCGSCMHFYKVQNGHVYRDSVGSNTDSVHYFYSAPLTDTKYQLARPLADSFLAYFANDTVHVTGCPNCADQGRIVLTYLNVDEVFQYYIDPTVVPANISSYIAMFNSIYPQLQQ